MCFFDPKIWIFGAKSQFFVLTLRFLLMEQMTTIPGAPTFPSELPPKKFPFPGKGSFFGAHPCFWPFLAIDALEGQLPLILVRFQRNSGESSGPSKNDPEGQRTRSGPQLRRNGRFYVRPKSGFWPKSGSYPKKSPKMIFPPLIIWAKALFFFEQLFPVGARTWLEYGSDSFFLGPKFRFLVQKSDFCHTTPFLVDDPFLALGIMVNFRPWERFFDFLFQSYSSFRKKV